ncbi:mannitol dehydrogenase family protein [Cellulosilyticum sp. ST5]|uniref:mannitol dehydrogenase family protein n=1 Tax=unclassified Cellulosilyticum TaxID=2643091 RepID=UPI000F8C94E3|nr:mannitol dehydrogenase family protein [Cellulosilyticum sp. WCF-2]QEH67982.1 mannitol dehydrogenase family protein [Cellulosilyticum sp. WCF-2]
MKLNQELVTTLKSQKEIRCFNYDRKKIKTATLAAPIWLHFGAGNIFRGFIATLQNQLLEDGKSDKGIIVVETYDTGIIDLAYKPYDDLNVSVTLKRDGSVNKEIIGSVIESVKSDKEGWQRLIHFFEEDSLQMVTFTITEKGYSVSSYETDFEREPEASESLMGQLTYLCYCRYKKGGKPIAVVSLDNCSQNGKKLQEAVCKFAEEWIKRGKMDAAFKTYLQDPKRVSFPWSMIDKITPQPNKKVQEMLIKAGFEEMPIIKTSKNTWVAPFVNAEEIQYLVIEDSFPNGRPCLEDAGVIFTTREEVERTEKMKVCTCLNPLHTALAIFGCLLDYKTIDEAVGNPLLLQLIEKIGYEEGLPVVTSPAMVNPYHFIKEVIEIRLPNPFILDSPWRIIADTSLKMPIRFGETLKAYKRQGENKIEQLTYIPLVIAGWCRYLLGINDAGKAYEVGPDPRGAILQKALEGLYLGKNENISLKLAPILSDESLFGVNLYEVGLGTKVEHYFAELTADKNVIQKVLDKYLMQ